MSHDVTGAPGILNDTSSTSPRLTAARNFIWHTTMKPQVLMMPSDAMFSTISNTLDGTR